LCDARNDSYYDSSMCASAIRLVNMVGPITFISEPCSLFVTVSISPESFIRIVLHSTLKSSLSGVTLSTNYSISYCWY